MSRRSLFFNEFLKQACQPDFPRKSNFTKVIIYDNIRKERTIIFEVEFYQKENGGELTEPYVKQLKGGKYKGLYELRIKFSSDIARIFYFTYYKNKYILLHGFIKKTISTPTKELDKALKYMEDYKRRNGDE